MSKTWKTKTIMFLVASALMVCVAAAYAASPTPVTAIDVALEPDSTMIQRAETVNARLRMSYPKGFALDKKHHPHITCLQRYVRTADLDKIYGAVGAVLNEENLAAWKLKAFKYYYIPWDRSWPCRHSGRADRQSYQVPTETDRRHRPIHGKNRDGQSVRYHGQAARNQPVNDRLCRVVRTGIQRQELQSARHCRPRYPGCPE